MLSVSVPFQAGYQSLTTRRGSYGRLSPEKTSGADSAPSQVSPVHFWFDGWVDEGSEAGGCGREMVIHTEKHKCEVLTVRFGSFGIRHLDPPLGFLFRLVKGRENSLVGDWKFGVNDTRRYLHQEELSAQLENGDLYRSGIPRTLFGKFSQLFFSVDLLIVSKVEHLRPQPNVCVCVCACVCVCSPCFAQQTQN